MKFVKTTILSLVLGASFLVSGCFTAKTAGETNHTIAFGGLYESREAHYQPPSPVSFRVRKSEFIPGTDQTGNQASLLWGLVTFTDY